MRAILTWLAVIILLVNGAVFYHTWHITHFCKPTSQSFRAPDKMDFSTKVSSMFTGIYNPKLPDDSVPRWPYQQVTLSTAYDKKLDAWYIPSLDSMGSNGTVIILHGFKGNKSNMLPISDYFHNHGMNCFLLDFSGHGNSDGWSSTVGYLEGTEVEVAYQYVKTHEKGQVILFGSSMGAVAAMHAVSQYGIHPDKMILESPYGSMVQAVKNRFDMQGIPSFPLAQMVVFWGGVQEGAWGFNNRPVDCARSINMPTLLLYGLNDHKVTLQETAAIFQNLNGEKELHLFQHSGHTSFYQTEPEAWANALDKFLVNEAIAQRDVEE